jgi:hypothetical protein
MTKHKPEQEPVAREGFEKWAKSLPNHMDISRFEDGYSDCNTSYAWAGWQAALEQRKQLTEEEARDLLPTNHNHMTRANLILWVLRATERAHGITGEQT